MSGLPTGSRRVVRITDLQPAGAATRWAQIITDGPIRSLTQIMRAPVKRIVIKWNISSGIASLLDNVGAFPGGRL